MFPEIEESALEEYKSELFSYRERQMELKELEKERSSLGPSSALSYWVAFFLVLLVFLIFGSGDALFGNIFIQLALSACIGFYVHLIFESDFFVNLYSHGKLKETERQLARLKELQDSSKKKLESFESMVRDHSKAWLSEFFQNNLYKKRSGSDQFEEALSTFSSMLEEASNVNSLLVTTEIPLGYYEGYLLERTIGHSFRKSGESPSLAAARAFTRQIGKTQTEKSKEIVSPESLYRTGRKIDNWDEINKKRKLTGAKGEEIVFALEQEFFESIDRSDLAAKIRHASAEDGDGLGYDVLSFFKDGREKFIEVKSTTGSLTSPFYLSRNELGFIKEHTEDSFIYRVLVSEEPPQIKASLSAEVLEGSEVTPVNYIVRTK